MAGRFGDWVVVKGRTLPRGGQGDVFLVSRPGDDGLYVLKRLRNPKRHARFAREVETMRRLVSAGVAVPPVIAQDVTTDRDARPYYVMPFYRWGSLQAAVENRRYADDHATGIDLLRAIGRALAETHARGYAHRDAKPANILLGDDDQPLLTDLGLALTVEEQKDEARLTESAEAIGSRLYIAPENESGFNPDVDQRPADFYAYAKLAWALLAGLDPPARERQTEPDRRLATVSGVPQLGRLDSLFEGLLAVDPRARLTDWELVDQELAATAHALRGETSSFDFWFGLLERYVEKNSTAAVAANTMFEGLALGRWCSKQRSLYRQHKLSVDRTQRLQALRGWEWDWYDSNWERMFALLEKYLAREKTIAVPRTHLEEGEPLGRWVRKQRNVYNGVHGGGRLTERQIAKLVALPGWSWDLHDYKWERGYRALLAFYEREGDIRVPSRGHIENGVNLSAWITRQRHHYTIGRIQRQGDHVERLSAIPGWKWSVALDERWESFYRALLHFATRENHADVPQWHVEGDLTLGSWVARQRGIYGAGKMAPDRVARLKAVRGWLWRKRTGPSKYERAAQALERSG